MSNTERTSSINPADAVEIPPRGVERIAIVIHDFGGSAPVVRSSGDVVTGRPVPVTPARVTAGRHHLDDSSWIGLVERILHSWPITLRLGVLLVVLATGTAAVAAAVGVVGQVLLVCLALRGHRLRRRRLDALRTRLAEEQPADAANK